MAVSLAARLMKLERERAANPLPPVPFDPMADGVHPAMLAYTMAVYEYDDTVIDGDWEPRGIDDALAAAHPLYSALLQACVDLHIPLSGPLPTLQGRLVEAACKRLESHYRATDGTHNVLTTARRACLALFGELVPGMLAGWYMTPERYIEHWQGMAHVPDPNVLTAAGLHDAELAFLAARDDKPTATGGPSDGY